MQGVQLATTAFVTELRRAAVSAGMQSKPTNLHNQDVVPFGTQAALRAYDMAGLLRLLCGSLAVGPWAGGARRRPPAHGPGLLGAPRRAGRGGPARRSQPPAGRRRPPRRRPAHRSAPGVRRATRCRPVRLSL
ncbi:aromatic amino acid lyase [Nonomuraea sp. M3C6]|uniref:Aromatic amino acid lyase n=1 Tax=Nonomuraea marmarensis TaxID=3351344 RepID=A0ABW7ATT8_9ACTN